MVPLEDSFVNGLFYYYNDHLGSTAVIVRGSTGAVIGGGVARYLPFGDYRTTPAQTATDPFSRGTSTMMTWGWCI